MDSCHTAALVVSLARGGSSFLLLVISVLPQYYVFGSLLLCHLSNQFSTLNCFHEEILEEISVFLITHSQFLQARQWYKSDEVFLFTFWLLHCKNLASYT